MKKLLYILLILGLQLSTFAGNADKEKSREKVVAGKVVDAFGESIAGAKITIPETGEVFYSDFDGHFKFSVKTDKEYSISVNTLGYKPLELKSTRLTAFSDFSLTSL
ncbi:MAG: carboxypeptidase-like regulatory domain-containing protein [Bacteroidia bacterium]|nr:carboxypeptidase-like regulatory domain-containing protein [Bacteroidia bacterium]